MPDLTAQPPDPKLLREALTQAVATQDAPAALATARALLALNRPTDTHVLATAFRKLRAPLLALGHRPLKTFIVRSVTVEPILPALHVEAALRGLLLDIETGGFGSYMDDLLNPASPLALGKPDLIFVLLDLEDIAGQLPATCARGHLPEITDEVETSAARVAQMLQTFRASNPGRLILQGCALPSHTSLGPVGDANLATSLPTAVRSLNTRLAELCRSLPDTLFFDLDQLAGDFGRTRWQDPRLFLSSRLAVAPAAFAPYSRALVRSALALVRAPRKVLCTDLDNTFWGGVLGEDGPDGIQTGSTFPGIAFLHYQRFLKELAARGILLAVTSKNNPEDVAEAFRLRSADLALTLDDFVIRKIGWNEKSAALREIAAELSLGLDSLVFVDDNPVECESIRHALPQVAVIEVPVDEPWRLTELLAAEPLFDTLTVTADDRNRTSEYRAQAQRESLSATATSREDFLQSLGIVCTLLPATEAPLARAVQLLGKTNQFNLTTRRYTAAEVARFADTPGSHALAIRVRDRFGDAGVVGLLLAEQTGTRLAEQAGTRLAEQAEARLAVQTEARLAVQADASCRIDSLLLSCRVIGRGIETALLAYLAQRAQSAGATTLLGEFIPSAKNAPAASFYSDHGFTRAEHLDHADIQAWTLDLRSQTIPSPPWLTLEGTALNEHTPVLSA